MVRDGIYYAFGMLVAAAIVSWLTMPVWAIVPVALGVFFLWFFRDPERQIPAMAGAIVSPADGKVTDVSVFEVNGEPRKRISIFLSVLNVHVNRSPIEGVVTAVEYRHGKFGNAMGSVSSEQNEQNIVTVQGQGQTVVFKQIAGLLARRIVFNKKVGESVARGERVGLIKFGSRVDVVMDSGVDVHVRIGDRVKGGSSVLGVFPVTSSPEMAAAGRVEVSRKGE